MDSIHSKNYDHCRGKYHNQHQVNHRLVMTIELQEGNSLAVKDVAIAEQKTTGHTPEL